MEAEDRTMSDLSLDEKIKLCSDVLNLLPKEPETIDALNEIANMELIWQYTQYRLASSLFVSIHAARIISDMRARGAGIVWADLDDIES